MPDLSLLVNKITAMVSPGIGFLSQLDLIYLFILFVVFIVIAYKLMVIAARAFVVAVVASLFPLFLNRVLGLAVEVSLSSMLFWALIGVGLYLAYELISFLYKTSKVILLIVKIVTWPFVALLKGIAKSLSRPKKTKEKPKVEKTRELKKEVKETRPKEKVERKEITSQK